MTSRAMTVSLNSQASFISRLSMMSTTTPSDTLMCRELSGGFVKHYSLPLILMSTHLHSSV